MTTERSNSLTVKICGITNVADAHAAIRYGADWLGFVFVDESSRCVSPDTAQTIIAALPHRIRRVGVFVDMPTEQIIDIATYANLDMAQLHGDETPDDVAALAELSVIKALALRSTSDLDSLDRFPGATLLIDAVCGVHAGQGDLGDWELAAEAAQRHPIVLAGGLNPANVANAVATVHPVGVDVSSGVEVTKGKKDHTLMAEFIDAARNPRQ